MAHLTEERVLELKAIARKLRVDILEMITKAASGHTGGSLSIADLITLLYFEEMHIDPANPKMLTGIVWCFPKDMQLRRCMPHWLKRGTLIKKN